MQEFNKGIYDYIIATDESNGNIEEDDSDDDEGDEVEVEDEAGEEMEECKCAQRFSRPKLRFVL